MIQNLPGYAEALRLGYTLHSYASNQMRANYTKDGVSLTVLADRRATLTLFIGLVRLTIDEFQFPHPNFAAFERQIRAFMPHRD